MEVCASGLYPRVHRLAESAADDLQSRKLALSPPTDSVLPRGGRLPLRPVRFVVRAGGSAWVVLNNDRCDLGRKRAATRVPIANANSPGGALPLVSVESLPRPDYCGHGNPGSTLAVSPFEPTLRAALGG